MVASGVRCEVFEETPAKRRKKKSKAVWYRVLVV